MDLSEGSKITGRFNVSSEKTIDGELTFAGPKTSLYVHDKDTFELNRIANQCIWGQLHDLTKVTLVEPITAPLPGYAQTLDERYYFADIFPHYVVYGHQALESIGKLYL